jgi:aminocarboxymuconate-semialdehyde decarboxylase
MSGDSHHAGVVDVHAHAFPMPLLRELERAGLADLGGSSRGILVLDPRVSGLPTGAPVPFSAEHHDTETRCAAMDRDGVGVQAVSAPPYLFATDWDDRSALDLARRSNDALAELVAARPDRLVGLGSVPAGRAGAADEARRCLDALRFAGVIIGTAAGGRELDDPINEELWGFLATGAAFVLVHPSGAPGRERMDSYHLLQLVGFPAETALAAARIVFGGVLERHELVLCLAHGGGCTPGLRGRLDLGWARKAVAATVPKPPREYLRRLHYDTAVFDAALLRDLVREVSALHVLVGTDVPFDLADRDPGGTVVALGLSEAESAAILGGNARRLLRGLPDPAGDQGGTP